MGLEKWLLEKIVGKGHSGLVQPIASLFPDLAPINSGMAPSMLYFCVTFVLFVIMHIIHYTLRVKKTTTQTFVLTVTNFDQF